MNTTISVRRGEAPAERRVNGGRTGATLRDVAPTADLTVSQVMPCAAEPERWYPDSRHDASYAVGVCRTCPARIPCLQRALDRREEYGVWGGLTPEERHRARKLRLDAAAAVHIDGWRK